MAINKLVTHDFSQLFSISNDTQVGSLSQVILMPDSAKSSHTDCWRGESFLLQLSKGNYMQNRVEMIINKMCVKVKPLIVRDQIY